MYFLNVTPHAVKTILYSHTYNPMDFHSRMHTLPNQIEIGTVNDLPLTLHFPRPFPSLTARPGDFFVLPPDMPIECRAEKGMHSHTTFGFILDMEYSLGEESFSSESGISLPLVFPGKKQLLSDFHKLVQQKSLPESREHFDDCGAVYSLFGMLKRNLSQARQPEFSPAQALYCARTEEYVSAHLSEKINVGDISAALGIHKNYLTNLFSAYMGTPLTTYVAKRKLQRITELCCRLGYSLSKAAADVGIEDESYASRMFKKYYGKPFTQYLKEQRPAR